MSLDGFTETTFTHDGATRTVYRRGTGPAVVGAGFEAIEIDSRPGNPHGIKPSAHSVVTTDLVDEAGHPTRAALERVIGFFRERLA